MIRSFFALALVCAAPQLAQAGAGGPDASGYRWVDSAELGGPTYSYEGVNGPRVAFSDDSVSGPHPIGFSFRYYGQSYTQFWVSSNGFMTLTNNRSSGCCSGYALGGGRGYGSMIAGYWTDLLGSAGTYQTRGEAGRRVLVYQQEGREYSRGPSVQYQIKLYENSGAVEIHVRTAGVQSHNASIGIQNQARNVGLTYRSGRFSINNTAVRFSHNSPPELSRLGPFQVYHGQRLSFVMGVTEPDQDEIVLEVSDLPEGASFNDANGKFRWIPSFEDVGQHELRFHVEEQRDDNQQPLSDETTVLIDVLGLNQPPVVSSVPPAEVIQGETLEYRLIAADIESEEPVQCRLGDAPETAELESCNLTWVADAAPGTEVDFSVSVSDHEGASSSQRFTVLVQSHPEGPVAVIQVDPRTVGPGWLELDGEDSVQGVADELNYRWVVISWPQVARQPRMERLNEPVARALLSYRGEYKFGLTVSGSVLQSLPSEVEVTVINVAPVPMVSEVPDFELSDGDERAVSLSGLGSEDPNPEDSIECVWTQTAGPEVELLADALTASLLVRSVGDYGFALVCTDGELSSDPATVNFRVSSPQADDPVTRPTPAPGGCMSIPGIDSWLLLCGLFGLRRRRRAVC